MAKGRPKSVKKFCKIRLQGIERRLSGVKDDPNCAHVRPIPTYGRKGVGAKNYFVSAKLRDL